MRRESISVSTFCLLALCAAPAGAQHGMGHHTPTPPADNRPGSVNVTPPSQRDAYAPPGTGQTSPPTTRSVDQVGPAAVAPPADIGRLQQSISAKEQQLSALYSDRSFEKKIEASRTLLRERYEAARAPYEKQYEELNRRHAALDKYEQVLTHGGLGVRSRLIGEDKILAEMSPVVDALQKIDATYKQGREMLDKREAQFQKDWQAEVSRLSGELKRDRQALVDVEVAARQRAARAADESARASRTDLLNTSLEYSKTFDEHQKLLEKTGRDGDALAKQRGFDRAALDQANELAFRFKRQAEKLQAQKEVGDSVERRNPESIEEWRTLTRDLDQARSRQSEWQNKADELKRIQENSRNEVYEANKQQLKALEDRTTELSAVLEKGAPAGREVLLGIVDSVQGSGR